MECLSRPPLPRRERGAIGVFVTHPRYRSWLARCGVVSADTALSLPGEVVSGHVDRHVVRVELHSGSAVRVAFLKREHVVGRKVRLRNKRAGYGWVSRSEREAKTLASLEAAGLPGPQWLAYGEDASGRAFLLVEELAGALDLREFLTDHTLSPADRRTLAERVGRTLAERHAAGFGTPELAAKHLFVRPGELSVNLLDWQSSPRPGPIDPADRTQWFAALHATLADELASPRDRLRVLWAYRRTLRMMGKNAPKPERFGRFVRSVTARAAPLLKRSSVLLQRQPTTADVQQRLVWLADEAVVAIPEVAAGWPTPAVCEPFYLPTPTPTPPGGHREWTTLLDSRRAVVVRFTTTDPLGRFVAALRERPWRSPAATAARTLFHLQRHEVPAPKLLAFGQRTTSWVVAESFLAAELPPAATALAVYLNAATGASRRTVLRECGRLLRKLHAAGCRPAVVGNPNDPLFVVSGDSAVSVGSPFAVRLTHVSEAERKGDVRRLTAGLSKTDAARVRKGYLGADWADRAKRRR